MSIGALSAWIAAPVVGSVITTETSWLPAPTSGALVAGGVGSTCTTTALLPVAAAEIVTVVAGAFEPTAPGGVTAIVCEPPVVAITTLTVLFDTEMPPYCACAADTTRGTCVIAEPIETCCT